MKISFWLMTIMAHLLLATPVRAQLYKPAQSADALPIEFRGTVTYQGTHGGLVERGPRRGTREYGGTLTIELTFDGNAVSGRFWGTGGINSGKMSGTRNGSQCRLFEERGGDIIEGECSRTQFVASVRSQGARNRIAAQLEARATKFVDSNAVAARSPVTAPSPLREAEPVRTRPTSRSAARSAPSSDDSDTVQRNSEMLDRARPLVTAQLAPTGILGPLILCDVLKYGPLTEQRREELTYDYPNILGDILDASGEISWSEIKGAEIGFSFTTLQIEDALEGAIKLAADIPRGERPALIKGLKCDAKIIAAGKRAAALESIRESAWKTP